MLARQAADPHITAMALVYLALAMEKAAVWSSSPQPERAVTKGPVWPGPAELYEEALVIFRRLGDDWGIAMCLRFYSDFLLVKDSRRARDLATEAVEIASRLGERWVLRQALGMLARLALDSGDRAEARPLVEKGVALAGELNDLFNLSVKLGRLAQLEVDESRFADALALHERRVANSRLLIGEVATVTTSLGHLHQQRGARAEVGVGFTRGLSSLNSQESELGIATALCGVGRMALETGRPADAARLLGAAEAVLERLRTGPHALELRPSQMGPRRYQLHRDNVHARELQAAGRAAFQAMGAEAFEEAALGAGRTLSTAEAVALGLEQAARSADGTGLAAPRWDGRRSEHNGEPLLQPAGSDVLTEEHGSQPKERGRI